VSLKHDAAGPYSLVVEPGTCVALSGPSGSGKTLLLRMIADLEPHTGRAHLGDRDRDAMPAPAWRRLVTFVAAEPAWWRETAREHFAAPEAALPRLTALGLPAGHLDAPLSRLSTGERQRLALVRAVCGSPRFLLLDEPTSALDGTSRNLVEALLKELLDEGVGIVLISHDPEQATRLGARSLRVTPNGLEPSGP